MKKSLSSIFFTLLIVLSAFLVLLIPDEDGEYFWNPFDYARITEVDYKAVVVDEEGSNGKVHVTERLTFDIHAMSKDNLFWELWRDLPEAYIDGVKVEYDVLSVKQILNDGSEKTYVESSKLYWDDSDYVSSIYGPGKWYHSPGPYSETRRQYECLLFYINGTYRDTITFEIEYEMYNAALRYNDSSELYLSMYSEETIKHLTSYKGEILIPEEKMPSQNNYYANTYGTNAHSFPFEESDSKNSGYHTFSFELDESQLKFRRYNEYIEFALVSYSEDKHIFTEYASKNTYYNEDVLAELQEEQAIYDALPSKWEKTKMMILFISIASSCSILIIAFLLIKVIKKKHDFYEPETNFEYFRDIPSNLDPNFAAELVFCKGKASDRTEDNYAAAMLSLAYKGYIELVRIDSNKDWEPDNMKIIVKYNPNAQANVETPPLFEQPTINTDSDTKDTLLTELLNHMAILEQEKTNIESMQVNTLPPLTATEEQYFNLIIRHSKGRSVTLYSFRNKIISDYAYTNSFINNVKNAITKIGISEGYYQRLAYDKPKKQVRTWGIILTIIAFISIIVVNFISYQTRLDLAFGSFFILGIVCFISAIYLYIKSEKLILLTQFGENEYAKWHGLYHFLNSATLINERTFVEVALWEKYLIYATAFGISDKVIKALEVRCPEMTISPILSNPYYRSMRFRTSARSFRTGVRSAVNISRSGGHGGYGGGGRGGGGGGGGH